jgi:hypothetical protein
MGILESFFRFSFHPDLLDVELRAKKTVKLTKNVKGFNDAPKVAKRRNFTAEFHGSYSRSRRSSKSFSGGAYI